MALDLGELVAFLDLDTSKWDKSVDRVPGALQGKAAMFGAAGLVIGGVIAAAMTKGLTDAISFEDSLAQISGQLGLTEAESARVGASAGRVYAQNYGESVEQVQGVIGGVITQIEGMGEASDSVVEGMTAKVLNYASAFGFETSEAIAMVQQLMTNGLAGSADEAMDLMTASMQKVPEALRGDMADAITEYGPFLSDLGLSGQEAFDLLAKGAENGMYGIDKAGDALKEFTIRSTDMSTASVDAYEALGLNAEEMSNKILAGGDTAKGAFDEIVGGLLAMEDPAQRANTAIALFGTPLEDLGVTEIPNFLSSLQGLGGGMEDAAGSADAMGEKMGSSTAAQMEMMNRQVQIMMSDLMAGLLPVLKAVFGFLAENPAVVQGLAIALGILAIAFFGVAAAMWAASLTPISLIIGAIIIGIGLLVAAIIWLVANWDAVWAWITEVFEGFVGWITGVLEGLAAWWNEMWAGFGTWVEEVWSGFISWIESVFEGFATWLKGVGDGIATWWNGLWEGIGSFISDVWNGFVSFVRAVFLSYVTWLISIGLTIISWWNGLWNGISSFFKGLWEGIVSWAESTISNFIAGWRAVWNGLTSFFSGLWSGISNGIRNTWEGVLSFFRGIPDTIMGFFSGIGSWLWNAGRDLINGLLNGIRSLAGTIGSFFLNLLPDWIVGPFKAAMGIASPSKLFDEFGQNTVEGYLRGVEKLQPRLDKRMGALVDAPTLSAEINARAASEQDVDVAASPVGWAGTFNYYAAENRSLTAEEELFAALGSPRAPFGGTP